MITSIRERLSSMTSRTTDRDADLALGLPLESHGRTIYPVFLDPRSGDGREPRQIGFLEIHEHGSDFTSLEPDYRPALALPAVLLLLVVGIWTIQRVIRLATGE